MIGLDVVQAPTAFQFEFWAYPFAFWMAYIIIFIMVAAFGGGSSRATVYLILVGWTYSSLVMVMMGMLPITFPLLLTVMTAVYVWRFR